MGLSRLLSKNKYKQCYDITMLKLIRKQQIIFYY